MIKPVLHTVLLLVSLSLCLAFQRADTPARVVIKAKFDWFNADNLGNSYLVKDDELVKYLPNGKLFARYSNLKLGSITGLDVTNPLKLLLYYRDFQQIVFLDNQLSVNSQNVSLEALGYEQTELACASNNNSFWIYNKQNNELLRFNENSKKIASTGNLKQVLQSDINPTFMMEHNGYLYLNCPENGIYVFDMFGTFSRVISLRQLREFRVNETILYFQRDSLLCSYDYKLFEEVCKSTKEASLKSDVKYINGITYKAFRDSLVVLKP